MFSDNKICHFDKKKESSICGFSFLHFGKIAQIWLSKSRFSSKPGIFYIYFVIILKTLEL